MSTQEKLHEPTILGKMVRDYRKSLGLNQTEFALLFGRTTPAAVSFWESGFREIPGSLCIALIDSAKREELESLPFAHDTMGFCEHFGKQFRPCAKCVVDKRLAELKQSEESE